MPRPRAESAPNGLRRLVLYAHDLYDDIWLSYK